MTTTTKKPRKSARPAAGHWRCDVCAEDHPKTEIVCLLGGVNPDTLPTDRAIVELFTHHKGVAILRWNALRKSAATNDELAAAVRAALQEFLIPVVNATDIFTVVWDPNAIYDGELIELWLLDDDEQREFDSNEWKRPKRSPDLAQPRLLTLMRYLFGIPLPSSEAPTGETPGAAEPAPAPAKPKLTHGPKRRLATPPPDATVNASGPDRVELVDVAAIIVPPNANPRKSFDQEAHERLVTSIRTDGIISPLSVRPGAKPGTFELLAGERRLRAAKAVPLKTVPAIVKQIDDNAAARIRLAENFIREGLNAIEEAAAFQTLIDEHGFSQRELAEYFDLSQGKIGNSVRLLKLPAAWQQRVFWRETTATMARQLATFADCPLVISELDRKLKSEFKTTPAGESINTETFETYLDNAIDVASRPLSGGYFDYELRTHVSVALSKKDREREDLDIRDVPTYSGKPEKRAFNLTLWNELQAAGEARNKVAADKKAKSKESDAAAQKKLTPAEQREAARKKVEQFNNRVAVWYHEWLQARILERLQEIDIVTDLDKYLMIALYFAVQPTPNQQTSRRADEMIAACGSTKKKSGGGAYAMAWPALDSLDALSDVRGVLRESVRAWCAHPISQWGSDLSPQAVRGIAAEVGVSLETDWKLSRDYLELHTKDQLVGLAKEFKVKVEKPDSIKRTDLLDLIAGTDYVAVIPAELAKLVKGLK